MSRSVLHFLLSLVLLVSQQMALAHGLSHWDEARQHAHALQSGPAPGASDGPDTTELHDFCAECAFDTQLDVALPLPSHALPLPAPVAIVGPRLGVDGVRLAPPQRRMVTPWCGATLSI